jgi:phosphoglycerate kinase
MRTVRDIPVLENIPVLVRGALNVPIENGKVVNDYRLREAVPTLSYLCKRGARVILISHIGDTGAETLAPVAIALGKLLPNVSFSPDIVGEKVRAAVRNLMPGHLLVLENLRRNAGEKDNAALFARELALLADVFVQDSFDTCHRSHASIIGIPKLLPSYAGLTLEREVLELSKSLSPKHPSLAVIGGAKFTTKKALLETLLGVYDSVFVGGALANDFIKASGQPVGKSLVSTGDLPAQASEAPIKELLKDPKLILPRDFIVIPEHAKNKSDMFSFAELRGEGEVRPDEIILDFGPRTENLLRNLTHDAKTILWNGPLGNYENGFTKATNVLADAAVSSGAYTVLGGGDTIAAVESLGLLPRFSFVSTGGGAMLDFLANGTLPGIEALG